MTPYVRALGCALSLSLALAGCSGGSPPPGPPPGAMVPPPDAAGMVAAGGGNVVPTNTGNLVGNDGASVVPGLDGAANVNGAAFAGADVSVYRLGDPKALGTGRTDEQGRFHMELGSGVKPGLALKVVATKGDQTLAAVGASRMVAAGGGNMVAAGGGNMVAAGGGNMVAAGGGNIVAAGGLNYALAQAPDPVVLQLSLASTLAVVLLAPRLEAAGDAATGRDGLAIAGAVSELLTAFDEMIAAAVTALTNDPALAERVTGAVDPASGQRTIDVAAVAAIITAGGLATTFQSCATKLGNAIAAGIDAGGTRPDAANLREIALGGIVIPEIRLPEVIPSEREPSTTDPGTTPGGGTTTPDGSSGSSGGSGGGSGDDGADDEDEEDAEPGTVGLSGNLERPTYQPGGGGQEQGPP